MVFIYQIKPDDFLARVEVSACYLEVNGQLLLLQSGSQKSEAGKWGVPAGKLEAGETPIQAAQRELFEETGIAVSQSQLKAFGALYVRKPNIDYIYHMFRVKLVTVPPVHISPEHQNYGWVSESEIEKLPLMAGAPEVLQFYKWKL